MIKEPPYLAPLHTEVEKRIGELCELEGNTTHLQWLTLANRCSQIIKGFEERIATGELSARPEVGTISWQAQAYVKLGLVRDMMIPADVLTVQQFIGPIPESAPSPLGTIK